MLITTACTRSGHIDDPAYGGFFRGIENINDGTYDVRIATREQKIAALQARQKRIMAERNSLQRQGQTGAERLASLKKTNANTRKLADTLVALAS